MWANLLRVTSCIAVLGLGPVTVAAAQPAMMADYMTMEVCTDAEGNMQYGIAPIDDACKARRKIAAGELPPYRLRDWPPAGGRCQNGLTVKYNIPLIRQGVERFVSFTDRANGAACESDADDETARGISVQGHDGSYAFIMASWSPVAMSSFESPLCATALGSAARFYRGWVVAPEILPNPGKAGWGVFPSHLATGAAAGPFDPCPAHYNAALTMWVRGTMAFGSATLDALVSHHYARADASRSAPGAAMQMERTYWTQEFGLSRWEKWAREDWVHPRRHLKAAELAGELFSRQRCNAPFNLPAQISPHMTVGPVTGDGMWRQETTDPHTGERHVWVMTLCEDYTNLARTPPSASALANAERLNNAYWRVPQTSANGHTGAKPQ